MFSCNIFAGNHDIEFNGTMDASLTFKGFEKRYHMPAIKPAEFGKITHYEYNSCCPSAFQEEYNYGNSFFSFDSGMTHVLNLNCYSTSDTASAQYKWLVDDLKAVDRSVTPWVIAQMHCPWYNSNTAHHDEYQTVEMKKYMEQVFYDNHVTLVFAGHVHAYERTYAIFNNNTEVSSPHTCTSVWTCLWVQGCIDRP
jgi:Calcineurin-like phosphoesterase